MFQPWLQISLNAFIHREVTRKQGCEFTNTYFALIDDPTASVKLSEPTSFRRALCFQV